jgi:zinc protease
MRKLIVFLLVPLILTLAANHASAQKLNIQEHRLENGLKVLTLERHATPTVSIYVIYKVGSRNESPGHTGLSHMLEHMLFMSTENFGPHQMDRIITRNGGEQNGATGDDYTFYYQTMAADRLELAIAIEAERMQNAQLKEKEFLSEREVVKEERRMRVDNDPFGTLYENFTASVFILHPYRISTIGWMDDLNSMRRDDAYRHYKNHYTPNNSIVTLVGDFETENALQLVRKHFGKIPKGPDPTEMKIVEPKQNGERRVWVHKEGNYPIVLIGYHVPQIGHADFYVLDIIGNILSSGRSSRLYKTLVYEKQLALGASGYAPDHKDPTLFQVTVPVRPGKTVEEVETAVYEIIEDLKTNPVSDNELQKAKNQVISQFYFRQQSNSGLAETMSSYEAYGVGYDYINTYPDKMSQVAKEDIIRVAKEYFDKKNRTVAILVPEKPQNNE